MTVTRCICRAEPCQGDREVTVHMDVSPAYDGRTEVLSRVEQTLDWMDVSGESLCMSTNRQEVHTVRPGKLRIGCDDIFLTWDAEETH